MRARFALGAMVVVLAVVHTGGSAAAQQPECPPGADYCVGAGNGGTTPGGGGDKVKYLPYKELEPALKKTLESVFDSATAVPSPQDKAFMAANNISYVFVPTIETNSSSDSAFTWPPTHFEVSIQAKAYKGDGSMAWQSKSVKGVGDAQFSEFKHDFSLSARRASLDAMNKLKTELTATQALK